MLNWVFGNKARKKKARGPGRKRPSYDKAKEIAAKGKVAERRELASHEDLEPELLYYFASDDAPEVRRQVARNDGTPLQADVILATDRDDEVRQELAHKIGRLVPTLTKDENERLTTMAIEVLGVLARDHLPQVRAIVAEEIKLAANLPHDMVRRLAEDVEAIVAVPVLEYSPLLNDQDLLQIIAGGVGRDVLSAISRRQGVIESVVEAVVDIRNVESLRVLLGNQSSRINVDTLEKIAIVASGATELHQPMVDRDSLPVRIIRRIAGFVSASLVDRLIERNDLEEGLVREIRQAVRRRIDHDDYREAETDRGPADERARRMFEAGKLNDTALIEAIGDNDQAFFRHALILLSGLPSKTVAKMLNAGSGKAAVALCWKSGLEMSTAEALQSRLGRIKENSKLKALEDGGYPMSEDDLEWQVEFFST